MRSTPVLANGELHPRRIKKHNAKWLQQFFSWLTRKRPVELWSEIIRDAKTYEDWEEAAFQLDVLTGNDLW